ncbi:actin-related protein ARPC3, partial [Rhodotorula sp. JG-1b]
LPPHLLADPSQPDIIDEALTLFRANSLFRNFEIKNPADRALIYLTLFIGDCLGRIAHARTWGPQDAQKYLTTHALSQFSLPGEPGFPLNQVFVGANPGDRLAADALRSYLTQARQETVLRLVERYVYSPTDPSTEGGKKASKWWMAFSVMVWATTFPKRKNSSALYDATCKHGDIECRGNIQQLSSLQFVQCLNYGELSRIGTDNAASACAKVVGHNWDAREQHCVDGKRGRKLLRKSVKRTHKHEVQKSATVLINDEVICVHDGSWQSCPGGHEIGDFVRQIEAEWKRINPEKKHAE